jgi:hypothetical protein
MNNKNLNNENLMDYLKKSTKNLNENLDDYIKKSNKNFVPYDEDNESIIGLDEDNNEEPEVNVNEIKNDEEIQYKMFKHFDVKLKTYTNTITKTLKEYEKENRQLKDRLTFMENRFETVIEAMYRMKEKMRGHNNNIKETSHKEIKNETHKSGIIDNRSTLYELSDAQLVEKLKKLNIKKKITTELLNGLMMLKSDYEIILTDDDTYENLLDTSYIKTKEFVLQYQYYFGSFDTSMTIITIKDNSGLIITINEKEHYPIKIDKLTISQPIHLAETINKNIICITSLIEYFEKEQVKINKEISFIENIRDTQDS